MNGIEITIFSKDKKLVLDVYYKYVHTRHDTDLKEKPSIGNVLDPYEVFWILFENSMKGEDF